MMRKTKSNQRIETLVDEVRVATYDAVDLIGNHIIIVVWIIVIGVFSTLKLMDLLQQRPLALLGRGG